jgi:hypothetical protein
MDLFLIGVSYRLFLTVVFYAVTKKEWFVKQFPILGTLAMFYSLFFQSPLHEMHVLTIIGFFSYDVIGFLSKTNSKKKPNKRKENA